MSYFLVSLWLDSQARICLGADDRVILKLIGWFGLAWFDLDVVVFVGCDVEYWKCSDGDWSSVKVWRYFIMASMGLF